MQFLPAPEDETVEKQKRKSHPRMAFLQYYDFKNIIQEPLKRENSMISSEIKDFLIPWHAAINKLLKFKK